MDRRSVDCYGSRIIKIISSCYTEDHIRACRHWIYDLRKRGLIAQNTYSQLSSVIDVTESNIFRKSEVTKLPLPPHLIKRIRKEKGLEVVTNTHS